MPVSGLPATWQVGVQTVRMDAASFPFPVALPTGITSGEVTIALVIWAICLVVAVLPGPGGGGLFRAVGSLVSFLLTVAFTACVLWGGWAIVSSMGDTSWMDSTSLDPGDQEPFRTVTQAVGRAFLIFPALFIGGVWRRHERWLALAALLAAAAVVAWLQVPTLL